MTFVVVYVSVASKPDKHRAREDVSEKYGNDQASLDPLNIVKDCVAGLMDRPSQRRLKDTHRNNTRRRVCLFRCVIRCLFAVVVI